MSVRICLLEVMPQRPDIASRRAAVLSRFEFLPSGMTGGNTTDAGASAETVFHIGGREATRRRLKRVVSHERRVCWSEAC
jgi:hypothetical protein